VTGQGVEELLAGLRTGAPPKNWLSRDFSLFPRQSLMAAAFRAANLLNMKDTYGRVTVEDCVDKIPNRFDLVLAAGFRARPAVGRRRADAGT